MGLTSWVTALLCFLNIGPISPPPHFSPSQPKSSGATGVKAYKLETEACLFISWVNICRLLKKKRERERGQKETVLMLLEKLPTGMTKLRSGSLSVQLDLHERWEIVAAQTARSAGQSSNENNRVCKATVRLTQGLKISCNNAGVQLGQRGFGSAPGSSELVFIPPPDAEHLV